MAMTGPQHYERAEDLLTQATDHRDRTEQEKTRLLAEAQVHATLALVAANVYGGGFNEKDVRRWQNRGVRTE